MPTIQPDAPHGGDRDGPNWQAEIDRIVNKGWQTGCSRFAN
jgi:hypothetical protein